MCHTQTGKKSLDRHKYHHHIDNDSISGRADLKKQNYVVYLLQTPIWIFLRKIQVHEEYFYCIAWVSQTLVVFQEKSRYLCDHFCLDDAIDKKKCFNSNSYF